MPARDPRRALIAIIVISTIARSAAAFLLHTPLYFPDEYLYSSLARAFAHGQLGLVRGQHVPISQTVSYVVPLLTAPVWALHDVNLAYRMTQFLGSAVFSCAALPAYALARTAGVGVRAGLLVAALSLLVPPGLFSGMVVAEPWAYTAFLVTVLLAVRAVERSSPWRLAAAAAASLVLIVVGGLQFAVVPPALVLAALPTLERRQRIWSAAGLVVVAVVIVAVVRSAGSGAAAEIGAKAHELRQPIGETITWLWINAFLLATAAGWVTAPGAAVGLTGLVRSARRVERFVGALSLLLLAGFLLEAAQWSALSNRTYERFSFYAVPFLLIGFARWAAGTASRRRMFAAIGAACVLTAEFVPFARGMHVDSPHAPPLTGLAFAAPSSTALVWAPLFMAAAVVTIWIGGRRRPAVAALAAAIAVSCAAVSQGAVISKAWSLPVPRLHLPRHAVYVAAPGEDEFARMRALFWNPRLDPTELVVPTDAVLRPDGRLSSTAGAPLTGLYVAGPTVRGLPAVSGNGVFEEPIDALAVGWYHDGYLSPLMQITVAGRQQGREVRVRLWSDRGAKRVLVQCPGERQRRWVGRQGVELALHADRNRTRACTVRLIAGVVDVVRGREVSVRMGLVQSSPGGSPRA